MEKINYDKLGFSELTSEEKIDTDGGGRPMYELGKWIGAGIESFVESLSDLGGESGMYAGGFTSGYSGNPYH